MSDVVIVDPTTDPRWHSLAMTEHGSLFVSPPWLRALRDTYGFEFSAAMGMTDGAAVDGVAWSCVHDLRGERIIALPFCDYANPIVASEARWLDLSAAVFDAGLPVSMRLLDAPSFLRNDDRIIEKGLTAWHAVDLTSGPEVMWRAAFENRARRSIRKAEACGVTVRRAETIEDVSAFHDLHCGIRRNKYRLLAQPLSLFENIWREFSASGDAALMLAEKDGIAIGGTFYLAWGDTLYYKFNASRVDHLDGRPNDLLTWSGMVYGHERNLALLDFGQSDLDQESLIRYKEKYATERRTITRFTHHPAGHRDDAVRIAGDALGSLTSLLTEPAVPEVIYRQAGALLYRNFC